MKTSKTIQQLQSFGVQVQNLDINQRIQKIIDEQNKWLEQIGRNAADVYGLSEKAYNEMKLGGI